MSDKLGYYKMQRGWMENGVFADEPFTEPQAWIWMIEEACWQPTDVPVGTGYVRCQRGQFSHSLRFMAERFGWTFSKIRCFVEKLKKHKMCSTGHSTEHDTEHSTPYSTGRLIITICNYNEYQDVKSSNSTGHSTEHDTEHSTGHSTKKKEINKLNKPDVVIGGQLSGNDVYALGEQLAAITGWDKSPNWFGDYSRLRVWLERGIDFDLDILPTFKRVMAKWSKPLPPGNLKYFEQAVADAHAERMKPMPQGNASTGAHAKSPEKQDYFSRTVQASARAMHNIDGGENEA